MKLYMKQKMFSLKQDFSIYDSQDVPYFRVEGKLFSLGRQLTIYNARTNEELAYIKEEFFTLLTRMAVYRDDELVANVKQKFSFFRNNFEIQEIGWHIEGDFWGYNYVIKNQEDQIIARIQQKLFSWVDTFEFDIADDQVDPVTVVAVILAIDACRDKQNSGA